MHLVDVEHLCPVFLDIGAPGKIARQSRQSPILHAFEHNSVADPVQAMARLNRKWVKPRSYLYKGAGCQTKKVRTLLAVPMAVATFILIRYRFNTA